MKQTWKIINNLIVKTKKNDKLPLQFIDNGDTLTNPNDIANRFNNYFINVGPTLSYRPYAPTGAGRLDEHYLAKFMKRQKRLKNTWVIATLILYF